MDRRKGGSTPKQLAPEHMQSSYQTVMQTPLAKAMGITPATVRNARINWIHTQNEAALVTAIVRRAVAEGVALNVQNISEHSATELFMDIINVHLNGCPLNLHRLLETADNEAFWADLRGIKQHVDRANGGLLNGFKPQFAWTPQ